MFRFDTQTLISHRTQDKQSLRYGVHGIFHFVVGGYYLPEPERDAFPQTIYGMRNIAHTHTSRIFCGSIYGGPYGCEALLLLCVIVSIGLRPSQSENLPRTNRAPAWLMTLLELHVLLMMCTFFFAIIYYCFSISSEKREGLHLITKKCTSSVLKLYWIFSVFSHLNQNTIFSWRS